MCNVSTQAKWTPRAESYDFGRPFPSSSVIELFNKSVLLGPVLSANQALRVFEPGCGTGRVLLPLAEAFPACEFVGLDSSAAMLEVCQRRIQQLGLKNVELRLGSVEAHLPKSQFDLVIHSSLLHVVATWQSTLREFLELLSPAGIFCLIGDEGDLYDEALGRSSQPGNDRLLTSFWSLYREARRSVNAPDPESSQIGARWDLESSDLYRIAADLGYREVDRTMVEWKQHFSLEDLRQITEQRCYSSMFTLEKNTYDCILDYLRPRIDALLEHKNQKATSRHRALARFLSQKLGTA